MCSKCKKNLEVWRRQKRLKLQLFKQKQKQRVRYTVLHIKKIIINLSSKALEFMFQFEKTHGK